MERIPPEYLRVIGLETERRIVPMPDNISRAAYIDNTPDDISHSDTVGDYYLGNGARWYVDMNNHPEYATPEVVEFDSMLTANFAGEQIAFETNQKYFSEGWLHKYNILSRTCDAQLNGVGDHENYMVGGKFDIQTMGRQVLTHLVTRQIITEPGMVLVYPDDEALQRKQFGEPRYVLSQKVWDMGNKSIGQNSTASRYKPFIISRDQSFDYNPDENQRTDRLQIASGSANMYAAPIALRFAMTSAVLRLIEHDEYPNHLHLQKDDMFKQARMVANDTELTQKLTLENGQQMTAAEIQYELSEEYLKFAQKRGTPQQEQRLAKLNGEISAALIDKNPDKYIDHLEWHAKREIIARKVAKLGLATTSFAASQIDINWHLLGPENKLITQLRARGHVALMPTAEQIAAARNTAPDNTRARMRGEAIKAGTTGRVCWNPWSNKINGNVIEVNNAYGSFYD